MPKLTDQELKALCYKWQKRLRLLSWDINIEFKHRRELTDMSRHGEVCYNWETASATIKVSHGDELSEYCSGRKESIERIIVHELLELLINPITDDRCQTDKEQAINMITDALIGFKLLNPEQKKVEGKDG